MWIQNCSFIILVDYTIILIIYDSPNYHTKGKNLHPGNAGIFCKRIELLAFEVEETVLERTDDKNEKSIKDLFDKFDGLTFESQGSYTFNRDEVTDYE